MLSNLVFTRNSPCQLTVNLLGTVLKNFEFEGSSDIYTNIPQEELEGGMRARLDPETRSVDVQDLPGSTGNSRNQPTHYWRLSV